MTFRPPRILAPRSAPNPLDVLQHEVLQEKAATLARMARALEEALAELAACSDPARREALLDAAAAALWQLTVQRDVLGLPGSRTLARDYDVPAAVVARMGVVRRRGPEEG